MEEIIGGTRSDEEGVMGEESSSSSSTDLKLPKLRKLDLRWLPELKSICSAKMICDSIEVIKVRYCEKMEEIIGGTRLDKEGVMGEESNSSSSTGPKLPKLRELRLYWLPELKSICSAKLICDSIEVIEVASCEKMKEIIGGTRSDEEEVMEKLQKSENINFQMIN
jgi:disease resistance protein RPS2